MPEGAVQVRPSWALPAATPRFVGAASVLALCCACVRLSATSRPSVQSEAGSYDHAKLTALSEAVELSESLIAKALPWTFSVKPLKAVLAAEGETSLPPVVSPRNNKSAPDCQNKPLIE